VLECSAGLEVIEIACPAEHDTRFDHELELPTDALDPGREFGGQRFVHHRAATAAWVPLPTLGFELRDTGLAAATDGLAGARVWRVRKPADGPGAAASPGEHFWQHDGEFLFLYLLAGEMTLELGGCEPLTLRKGGSAVLPAGLAATVRGNPSDLALLEVRLPGAAC
jgi:uncharacterized cupin superfamily protein